MNAVPIASPLALLKNLFEYMDDVEIPYCHWKSTHGLTRALSGKTDLDLLVDRTQAQKFRTVMSTCDFRPVISHARRQFPRN